MFEVKAKQKEKVKLFGVEYEYRRPVVGDAKLLSKLQSKEIDDVQRIDLTIDFLCALGLPKDVIEQLDFEEYSALMTLVSAKEKKS
jgi:hypothetical protein